MAKLKFGMVVTDMRGKLGGHVFSKNRSGAYSRTKVTPTNPQTARQTAVRQMFAAISQAWSGLTDAVRAQWNEAVAEWQTTDVFGDLRNPSGKALHQRLSNQAQAAGYPSVDEVPAKSEVPSVTSLGPSFSIAAEELDLSIDGGIAGARCIVYATAPLSQGTKFVKNKLRQIQDFQSDGQDPLVSYAAYVAKFGAPSVGDNIYIAIKTVLPSGQAAPMITYKSEVEA